MIKMKKDIKESHEGGQKGLRVKSLLENKKGQEEIMGFMLVVILIVVIGLTFVFLAKPKEVQDRDLEVENLLYSVVGTSYNSQTIGDRVKGCEKGIGCDDLGKGVIEILDAALSGSDVVVGRNLDGYSINMSGGIIYFLSDGNLTGQSKGAATVVGDTLIRLRFYY